MSQYLEGRFSSARAQVCSLREVGNSRASAALVSHSRSYMTYYRRTEFLSSHDGIMQIPPEDLGAPKLCLSFIRGYASADDTSHDTS